MREPKLLACLLWFRDTFRNVFWPDCGEFDIRRYYWSAASGNKTVIHNDGVCQGFGLDQIFWLDQKRHSQYTVPDPYGIVIGDPALVPKGSQELWLLSAHGIDVRSAADPSGCSECR